MKIHKFYLFFVFSILILACNGEISLPGYKTVLPDLPPHWEELLGEAHWQLQWVDKNATWQYMDLMPGVEIPDLAIMQEWASPVIAYPYWPYRMLLPGSFRPAGAIFPWDASGSKIQLSWRAGVDAIFWKELAAAERTSEAAEGRLPWYLDWQRFRELLLTGNISLEVRQNPWLPDWKDIAQRTVQSGFYSSRISPRSHVEMEVEGMGGYWINSSPFVLPIDQEAGSSLILRAATEPDTWVSKDGVLRIARSGWIFME